MREIILKLSDSQVALLTDMLAPYVELSANITNQFRAQIVASNMPVKAKKVEEQIPEEKNNV